MQLAPSHRMCLQGHRTYTSFLHFLASVTLLAAYVGGVSISAVYYAFENPLSIVSTFDLPRVGTYLNVIVQDDQTPLHEMSLALGGIIFAMMIGPFLVYHMFLVT